MLAHSNPQREDIRFIKVKPFFCKIFRDICKIISSIKIRQYGPIIPAEAKWWPLGHHEAELSLNEVTFKSNLNIAEGVYSIP